MNDITTGAVTMDPTESAAGTQGRGPIYDTALRWLTASSLPAIIDWLGVDPGEDPVMVSESLPAMAMQTDLLVQVARDRLVHVEFGRRVERDLPGRMLEYRARIMRSRPDMLLFQHVLILADGNLASRFGDGEHAFRLHVTYLRERNPREFLHTSSLAPLAVLATAESPRNREDHLRAAFRVIRASEFDHRRLDGLVKVAGTLAQIYLRSRTILKIWKEAEVSLFQVFTAAEQQEFARETAVAYVEMLQEAVVAKAQAEGRDERRSRLVAIVLSRRFRYDLRFEKIAEASVALAALPPNEAETLIMEAEALDDLLAQP